MAPPIEELTSIHQILHLTHHRNKNQHRLAKWYKSFSQLRRQTQKLLSELETLNTYIALAPKSKKTDEARDVVEKRVAFLETWLLPKCYLAFSAVVADNQYAALGLMLLGTLARVRTVIRPLGKELDDELEVEVEGKPEGSDKNMGDDIGEVVRREELQSLGVEGNGQQIVDQEEEDNGVQNRSTEKRKEVNEISDSHKADTKERTPKPPRKKKKRRKNGDAFDDLFDCLI